MTTKRTKPPQSPVKDIKTFRLPPSLIKLMKSLSKREKVTMTFIVIQALEEYLEKELDRL